MREWAAGLLVAVPFVLGAAGSGSADRDEVFRFADPEIIESSGLVVADGLVVTVNDSGYSARVFTVDLDSGRTVGTTSWDGAAEDIEALAPAGAGVVWAGDIGDNYERRETVTVTRVPYGRFTRSVAGESHQLRYPDGPRDAEALLVHPGTGRLYVVTKDVFGGSVFAAPARLSTDRVNVLRRIGEAPGLVTDGAFLPEGDRLVLRSYGSAGVFAFPSLRRVATGALPHQQQGEGIAVAADGRLYLSSEGVRSALLRVDLPTDPALPAPSANPAPDPSTAGPSASPPSDSSSDGAAPADDPSGGEDGLRRDPWPWLLGGLVGLVAVVVLVRSLRPR